jgi:photosystem II stability/assembly factor-like uncharacterized protein
MPALEGLNVIVGTSQGRIYKSRDGGVTWEQKTLPTISGVTINGIRSIKHLGNGIVVAGASCTNSRGRILRSTDYGETWTDRGQVLSYGATWVRFFDRFALSAVSNYLVCSTDYQRIVRSEDLGLNWIVDPAPSGSGRHVSYVGYPYFLSGLRINLGAGFENFIMRSIDDGYAYGYIYPALSEQVSCTGGRDPQLMFVGTDDNNLLGYIYRSVNLGVNWTKLGPFSSQLGISQFLCFAGTDIVIASTRGNWPDCRFLRSTNAGLNWTDIGRPLLQSAINQIVEYQDGIAFAVTSASVGLVIRTDDYGASWSCPYIQFAYPLSNPASIMTIDVLGVM